MTLGGGRRRGAHGMQCIFQWNSSCLSLASLCQISLQICLQPKILALSTGVLEIGCILPQCLYQPQSWAQQKRCRGRPQLQLRVSMAEAAGSKLEHEDRNPLPSGPLTTSEMLPHLQICHPCECGKDLRSVAGKHMVPVRVVTRSKEQMIELTLKVAILPNNAED